MIRSHSHSLGPSCRKWCRFYYSGVDKWSTHVESNTVVAWDGSNMWQLDLEGSRLYLESIHYLHKSHNTPLLPPKNLHRHCFRILLGHFYVPGEIANNGYANVLGGNRGVLWDCASSEFPWLKRRCKHCFDFQLQWQAKAIAQYVWHFFHSEKWRRFTAHTYN